VRSLVHETLLLDTESTGLMASLTVPTAQPPPVKTAAQESFRSGVRGLWLSRDPALTAAERSALAVIRPVGDLPRPIAVTPWQDPWDPLFLDVNYSHPHSSVQADWKLLPDQVELTGTPAATHPPDSQVEVFDERARVTLTIVQVLESALVTKITLDVQGNP